MGDESYREGFGDLKRAKDAITILIGILDGVEADKVLKPSEGKALKIWLEHNKRFGRNPPFSDICLLVEHAISDGVLEKSEIDDIRFLVKKSVPILFHDGPMVYLQGLISGFAADGVLNDLEIKNLRRWLLQHEQRLSGLWPFDELFTLTFSFKETEQISPGHMNLIKSFMNDYMAIGASTELSFSLDSSYEKPTTAICTTDPVIEFQEKKFCITGKSEKYKRKEIYDMISNAGGIPTENIWCDYLVVCSAGSGHWAFQAYGRKIEAAIERRKMGHSVSIILETDLYDAIRDIESAS